MISLLVLILALITLYVLSGVFIKKLFIILFRIAGSREKASVLLSVIFLPGTFIHEISHFITALFLIVPVGQLNLVPEADDKGIKLGSVAIGKTDFVRASLIGLAPIIAGGGILFWAITFLLGPGHLENPWFVAAFIYLVFEITHTMFSSKRDLYAVLELVVFIAIVSIALVWLKIYAPFIFIFENILKADPFIQRLSYFLFVPIGIELIFLTLFRKVRI